MYCAGDKALGIMGALTGGLVCFVWMGRCLKASDLLPFSVLFPTPPNNFFKKMQRKPNPQEVFNMTGECTQTEREAFSDSMRSMGMGGSWLEAGKREFPRYTDNA